MKNQGKMVSLILLSYMLYMSGSVAHAEGVDGDAARGEVVFQQCSICHQVGPVAGYGVGPNLNGVIGRKIASTDFAYDTGLQKAGDAGLVWNKQMIYDWLAGPEAYIRGLDKDQTVTTKMSVKLSDEQSRRDVIAYLATFGSKVP